MLHLFPCKAKNNEYNTDKSSEYYNCDGRKEECYVCHSDLRGEARICRNVNGRSGCFDQEQCLEETKKYRAGLGKAPEPIIYCSKVLFRRAVYIDTLLKGWQHIPNKERSISFVSAQKLGRDNNDFFNDKDLDIMDDKAYIDLVLIPKLDPTEKIIVAGVKLGWEFEKIALATQSRLRKTENRYDKILSKLAIYKEKPRKQRPRKPIKTYYDPKKVKEIFEEVAEKSKYLD